LGLLLIAAGAVFVMDLRKPIGTVEPSA
jgi:hypothetical protein